MSQANTIPEQAPWLSIPSRAISVVEHPCIIKNVDKGISSLGGPNKLSKVSNSNCPPEHPWIQRPMGVRVDTSIVAVYQLTNLGQALRSRPQQDDDEVATEDGVPELRLPHLITASLRPDDPFAKRVLATPLTTNNLLLRVTVPQTNWP